MAPNEVGSLAAASTAPQPPPPPPLAEQLAAWLGEHPEGGKAWLLLYKAHVDRMLSDNERIWRTGAIFVPLSFAGFGAFAAHPTVASAAIIGGASSALMLIWNVIAENHRSFQQTHEVWIRAIEDTIGIPPGPEKKKAEGRLPRLVTKGRAIQRMRWWLFYGVTFAWLALGLLTARGVLQAAK